MLCNRWRYKWLLKEAIFEDPLTGGLWFAPDDATYHSSPIPSFYWLRQVLKKDSCLCFREPSTCLALAVWEEVHKGG